MYRGKPPSTVIWICYSPAPASLQAYRSRRRRVRCTYMCRMEQSTMCWEQTLICVLIAVLLSSQKSQSP